MVATIKSKKIETNAMIKHKGYHACVKWTVLYFLKIG